jgi:hypothetical protein
MAIENTDGLKPARRSRGSRCEEGIKIRIRIKRIRQVKMGLGLGLQISN